METGPDGALYVLRFSSPETLYRVSRRATADAAAAPRPQLRVWPNPARGVVRIASGPGRALGPVRVVDAAGRLVRRLDATAGSVEWDGLDRSGRSVAAGPYFVFGPDVVPVRVVRLR
jgi:hypothetical protein